MFLSAIGINHKTSSVDVREKFFLNADERNLLLSEFKREPHILEAFVLSTCNRTEIYALMIEAEPSLLLQLLCSLKKLSLNPSLSKNFYAYRGPAAVRHLFAVACGLDSLIVGEKEILGQVKTAIELSRKKGMVGRFLNILTNIVLRTAKKARSTTKIGTGGSSISWAAVQKAEQFLGTLRDKKVLIIGAGKMSHLAAGDFQRKGVGRLYVMNRTLEKGEALAQKFQGTAVDFGQLRNILHEVDVCITSSSCPHFLIEAPLVEAVMAQKNALLMIDISMPRNIHPSAGDVSNVTLIGLDELDKVLGNNIRQRKEAVTEVEKIITSQVEMFTDKWESAQLFSGQKSNALVEHGAY